MQEPGHYPKVGYSQFLLTLCPILFITNLHFMFLFYHSAPSLVLTPAPQNPCALCHYEEEVVTFTFGSTTSEEEQADLEIWHTSYWAHGLTLMLRNADSTLLALTQPDLPY
jgi:hypothetical protein